MIKFVILIPTMSEEVLDKCIASIDKKYYPNLYIIDNTEKGFAKKYGVRSEHHPENIGIARSWNIGARKAVEEKLDYVVLMSATIIFDKGMTDLVAHMEANANPYGLETQHSWHLVCFKPAIFKRIGYFDENLYPAYYEDSDYIRRMELAGIHNPMSKTQRLPKVEVAAGFQGNAHALKKGGLKVNMGAMTQYFIDKWGKDNSFESQVMRDKLFKYPFNNPKNGLDYWPVNSIEALKDKYELSD